MHKNYNNNSSTGNNSHSTLFYSLEPAPHHARKKNFSKRKWQTFYSCILLRLTLYSLPNTHFCTLINSTACTFRSDPKRSTELGHHSDRRGNSRTLIPWIWLMRLLHDLSTEDDTKHCAWGAIKDCVQSIHWSRWSILTKINEIRFIKLNLQAFYTGYKTPSLSRWHTITGWTGMVISTHPEKKCFTSPDVPN